MHHDAEVANIRSRDLEKRCEKHYLERCLDTRQCSRDCQEGHAITFVSTAEDAESDHSPTITDFRVSLIVRAGGSSRTVTTWVATRARKGSLSLNQKLGFLFRQVRSRSTIWPAFLSHRSCWACRCAVCATWTLQDGRWQWSSREL